MVKFEHLILILRATSTMYKYKWVQHFSDFYTEIVNTVHCYPSAYIKLCAAL